MEPVEAEVVSLLIMHTHQIHPHRVEAVATQMEVQELAGWLFLFLVVGVMIHTTECLEQVRLAVPVH